MIVVFNFVIGCNSAPTDKGHTGQQATNDLDPLDPGPEIIDPPSSLPFHLAFDEYEADLITCFMDTGEQKVTFYFQLLSGSSDTTYKNLVIDLYDSLNIYGFTSTLLDASDNLLWGYDLSIDTLNTESMRFIERTQTDSMTIERIVDDTSITEAYTINGVADEFVFHTTDQERAAQLHDWVLNGLDEDPPGGLTPLDSEIVATLRDFDEFYPTDNSLHNNPDGFVANDLMGSEPLQGWFIEAFPYDSPPLLSRPDWADKLCSGAGACAYLSCRVGLVPVCEVCGAIVVTCLVMDFFNLW
jgi:hypothetical protein